MPEGRGRGGRREKGRPLAADEFPLPAEQRLRSGQQRGPDRSRQQSAEGRQHDPIPGLPARLAELPFENPELVPQGENFRAQLGIAVHAHQEEVGNEANEGVGEAEEHGPEMI